MARGFNKAIIVGNLTRDPEVRHTSSQKAVATFTLAVNRTWRGANGETQEQVDFIPVVVWGAMGENCGKYLRKGSAALVEGRISVRSYDDKSGQKRYVTEIVAETVQFLGGGNNGPRQESSYNDNSWGAPSGGNFDNPSSFRDTYGDDFGGGSFTLDISKIGNDDDPGEEANIPF